MIHANSTTQNLRTIESDSVTSRQMFESASQLVSRFARCVRFRRWSLSQFDEVESVLASLPLAADEYAVACCRLRNARGNTFHGELGAAHYELNLLAHSLFAPRRFERKQKNCD